MRKYSRHFVREIELDGVGLVYSVIARMVLFSGAISFVLANSPVVVHAGSKYHFATPPGLKSQFSFWVKIYSKYTSEQAVIYDVKNPGIVYEVLTLPEYAISNHSKDEKIKKAVEKYKKILLNLANKKNKTSGFTEDEKRVHSLVGSDYTNATVRVRAQKGQKNQFKKGIVRSGRYIEKINNILIKNGLPEELSVLALVISYFNNNGTGADGDGVGIWQLDKNTAKKFMRVREDIDERRDPVIATHAAAKILKDNFQTFQSWALAITAFRHGKWGVSHARNVYGDNLVDIIKHHRSRTFGFDSKSFYAKFLAGYFVLTHRKKYFPGISEEKPLRYISTRLDDYVDIDALANNLVLSRQEIAVANPALLKPVLTGEKRIPRGYVLKVPADRFNDRQPLYKKINSLEKYNRQVRQRWHTVRKGDTLSRLSLLYSTSVKKIKLVNNIGNENKIFPGEKIRLPWQKNSFTDRIAAFSLTPSLWPVQGQITSRFGLRKSPITGLREKHSGLDIAALRGSLIRATADGVVVFSGKVKGYGNMIELEHGKNIVTRYAHNSRHMVKVGDMVRKGEVIAKVGNTGRSTGPHLHYEVLVNNTSVDPEDYLPKY